VGLDVVGVAIEAFAVVGDDHVGAVALQQFGDAAGGLFQGSVPETRGVVVLGPTHHPRVAVTEQLQVGDR